MSGRIKAGRDKSLEKIRAMEADLPMKEPDEAAEDAVSALAVHLGLGGGDADVMAQTWLRPLAADGRRGAARVRCVIAFLGRLLEGDLWQHALDATGLTGAQVSAFRFVCPELKKVMDAVVQIRREARVAEIGERVEDAAVELATVGEEVYNRQGEVVGRRRNVKAIEMLLPLAGAEYRKDAGGGGAAGRPSSVALTFNFGGATQSMGVVDV